MLVLCHAFSYLHVNSQAHPRGHKHTTQVPALIAEIISMHRDGRVLTSASMVPIIEMLNKLKQAQPTFQRAPSLEIPDGVRAAAGELKVLTRQDKLNLVPKATNVGHAIAVHDICKHVITEQLGGSKPDSEAKARDKPAEAAWVLKAAKEMIPICKNAWMVVRKSLERRGGAAAMPELRSTIARARSGKLFSATPGMHGPSRLSKEVWHACTGADALGHNGLWCDVLERPLELTMRDILKCAFAPAILDHPVMKAAIDSAADFSREVLERFLLEVR